MEVITALKEIFKKEERKFSFLSACILMGIIHIYACTNMLINHDAVNYYLTGESMEFYVGCGRWMLYLITRLSGIPTLTPVIMLICIVAVAASSVLVTELFEINNKMLILCINVMLATFPAVANSFCYLYNADGIFIAYFLAIFGVWLLEQRKKRYTVCTVLLLALTCGIYQLYWGMSVAWAYILLLYQFRKGKWNISEVYKNILRYVIVYGASIVLYYVLNKLILTVMGIDAAGYAGLDSMLEFGGVGQLINTVIVANVQVLRFYFMDGAFIKNPLMAAANIVLLGYILFSFWGEKKHRGSWWECILSVALIAAVPTVLNNISVAGKGYLHAVMMMPFVIPYIFVIASLGEKRERVPRWAANVAILAILFLGYNNFLTSNKVYARQELNYEVTYGYLNRMLMRIEETEAYEEDGNIPVCFINETPQWKYHIDLLTQNYPEKHRVFDECDNMVGCNVHTMIKNTHDIYDFYEIFLGMELTRVGLEEAERLGETEEFQKMGIYPAQDSMKVIDGVLVIKIPDKEE